MQYSSMTNRQKIFVKEYVLSKNASDAYVKAGFSSKYAGANAAKLLKNTAVQQAIDAEFKRIIAKYDITEETIIKGIRNEIDKDDAKASDRIRGWELLGKAKGLFRDNTLTVNLLQNITDTKVDKARKLLRAKGLQRPPTKK